MMVLGLLATSCSDDNNEADGEILDAGQGTAVLVRAAGRTLLYDSGPGDGAGRDLVSSVIAPALDEPDDMAGNDNTQD